MEWFIKINNAEFSHWQTPASINLILNRKTAKVAVLSKLRLKPIFHQLKFYRVSNKAIHFLFYF